MEIIDPNIITEFKDNYALLDLIDKKVKKDFDVCKASRQFEEFFCKECKEVICSECIDSKHSTHSLRKMSLSMFKACKNIRQKLDLGVTAVSQLSRLTVCQVNSSHIPFKSQPLIF